VIAYPGPFEIGWPSIKGQYWTDIYDVRSGERLVQIQGTFHGVEPHDFQIQAALLAEKYYVLPLQTTGMRRLLICDLDTAQQATLPSP
jgi:hypothetical protein